MICAREIAVRGVVQGVGFRPFVYRLALRNTLAGWVLNGADGVRIHLEGAESALEAFVHSLRSEQPPAATITGIDIHSAEPAGFQDFTIRTSLAAEHPTARISPDLPVCSDCLRELFDPGDRRYLYPYINCTNCGPRYSVVRSLPYDRENTTMSAWPLDDFCAGQYGDPSDRRFHAQPVACPDCGPHYRLFQAAGTVEGDAAAIGETVERLKAGGIVAVKGLGGYHLACDARNAAAVRSLRERKFRKEKPFALMVRDLETARSLVELNPESEALALSPARPVVLATAKSELAEVAPGNHELGVMLPYTPLHHLLFAAGAPDSLVMTSANRSSEPIAYRDEDALARLSGIADAFLIGERPIARRVDDSVARVGAFGPLILRRSRGYAPAAVATIPCPGPILAVGADLKNAITLVVNGQAFVSQHIGDLDQYDALQSFRETIADLLQMYDVDREQLTVAHDLHPEYFSTVYAREFRGANRRAVQHHRAHIASVLAERGAWNKRVIGVSFDGTGYGDDGAIWGGEFFAGSVAEGFERAGHLRPAVLPGGNAAARCPAQAAAGFLSQVDELPALDLPARYEQSLEMIRKGVRTFPTTSVGRLFDAAAAMVGFGRDVTFEGQAAIWLEQLARRAPGVEPYPFPLRGTELDFRPLLRALAEDRARGREQALCARAFHGAVAHGIHQAAVMLCEDRGADTVVLSGGVFQNEVLAEELRRLFTAGCVEVWTNHAVPPNDGGISLGQAALCTNFR